MNRIYFVRHGKGQDNVARKFASTWMDHSWTERGRSQALQTEQYLACKQIDGIFSSPMQRVRETAQILAGQMGMDLTVMDEFRELNVGELDSRDFAEEVRRTPERRNKVWSYPELSNERISPLFQSAIESTEEAIYNSLCMTETMTGTGGVTIPALPFSVVE